jgi:hypothetical protein
MTELKCFASLLHSWFPAQLFQAVVSYERKLLKRQLVGRQSSGQHSAEGGAGPSCSSCRQRIMARRNA